MSRKRKILSIILIVIAVAIGFTFFGEFEAEGERYSTSTQDLEVAKLTEIIELKNGDTLNLSIDIIQKEIAGQTGQRL